MPEINLPPPPKLIGETSAATAKSKEPGVPDFIDHDSWMDDELSLECPDIESLDPLLAYHDNSDVKLDNLGRVALLEPDIQPVLENTARNTKGYSPRR